MHVGSDILLILVQYSVTKSSNSLPPKSSNFLLSRLSQLGGMSAADNAPLDLNLDLDLDLNLDLL